MTVLAISLLMVAITVGSPAAAQETPPQPDIDHTATRIEVHENGSAVWTVQIWTRLQTDADIDGYRSFQRTFRNNTTAYLDPFRTRMERVVAQASAETGREMTVQNVTASTSVQEVPRRWGVVTYRLTWTNFAAKQADALVVGDVFQGGFFLAQNDTLTVVAPPGFTVESSSPSPETVDENTVTWVGEQSFQDEHPRVVLAPNTAATTDTPTLDSERLPFGVFGLVGLVLVLVIVGTFLLIRRGGASPPVPSSDRDSDSGSETDIRDASSDSDERSPEEADSLSDPVVTDYDRVLDLLEGRGGQMRQTDIAEALDWSSSKTSRILSNLAEEGEVEKLRIGRENIISLTEADEE